MGLVYLPEEIVDSDGIDYVFIFLSVKLTGC